MTLTTRLSVLQKAAPLFGGYQGNITSGTGTTAVLAGLVGVTSDDDLNDDLLVMPDAATDADQARIVTDWTGSTGTATFATRADTTYTSETYFTIPKNTFTLQECRQAVSRALAATKRTYRYVVPTRDDERDYQLPALTWLRNARDVDGVYYRPSPGLLHNEDFSYWDAGTTSAPDGWTLTGAAATVARGTAFASRGSYMVTLTSASATASLTQDVPYQLAKQLIDDLATVSLEVRCRAVAATVVRVGINNGTDTSYSSYHTGGSNLEDLTVSRTLTSAATKIQIVLEVATGTKVGDFDIALAVEGSSVGSDDWDAGSSGVAVRDFSYQLANIGNGVPALIPARAFGRGGQFVVVSRRPYADLTTDSASTEAPADVIEARTIYELASLLKPSQDRARNEWLMQHYGAKFVAGAADLIDKPVPRAQTTILVRGA